MNGEYLDENLVELGVASVATRGGHMGLEDEEGTLWLKGAGLADD